MQKWVKTLILSCMDSLPKNAIQGALICILKRLLIYTHADPNVPSKSLLQKWQLHYATQTLLGNSVVYCCTFSFVSGHTAFFPSSLILYFVIQPLGRDCVQIISYHIIYHIISYHKLMPILPIVMASFKLTKMA